MDRLSELVFWSNIPKTASNKYLVWIVPISLIILPITITYMKTMLLARGFHFVTQGYAGKWQLEQ